MKNNKGFTVVELLASFSLTMVIVVFLFEILIEIKNLYSEANTKTEVIQKQAVLINKIRNTFDTKELSGVICSKSECVFNFYDYSQTVLSINPESNTIVYDNSKYSFPAEVRFTEYGIETCNPENDLAKLEGHTAKNCYFKLHITISSSSLEKDYPINIVYPYVYDSSFVDGSLDAGSDYAGSKTLYMCKEESQTFKAEHSGTYRIELLGAKGGSSSKEGLEGGAGAYTSGEIYLEEGTELNVNVGCTPKNAENSATSVFVNGGFNGGGDGSSGTDSSSGGGGGATDVRIGGTSLNDRIMVAAGGSGAGTGENAKEGVPGGGLIAANSSNSSGPKGATQTSGGTKVSGSFGAGANASDNSGGSGGGGGYYGGAAGINDNGTGTTGTGGSSYISGHFGSNAVTSNSSTEPTNQSIHYSGKFFYDTVMYSGNKVPDGIISSTVGGYSDYVEGDGYALITYVDSGDPEEATKLSSLTANYPLGASVWLDGYNNDKTADQSSFIHNYNANIWGNFGTNGNNMPLSPYKWVKDGLDLSSKGEISANIPKQFTLSAVFSLKSYPSGSVNLIDGKVGLSIDQDGKVYFVNDGSLANFKYEVSKLNVKEYLTVVGTGETIKLYSNGEMVSEISLNTNVYSDTSLKLSGNLNGTLHRLAIYPTNLSFEDIKLMYEEDVDRFTSGSNPVQEVKTEYIFADENYLYVDDDVENVSDFSGNENDAKIIGTNNFDEENKCIVLDGNTYLEAPGDINYRYTAVLVVSSSNVSNNPNLMGNSTYPSLYVKSGKYAYKAQGLDSQFDSNFDLTKKEYITITYDGKNVNLYIDGIKKGNLGTTTDPESVEKAYIGKNFKGNLHKYALYDRVLLDEEIKATFEHDYNTFK